MALGLALVLFSGLWCRGSKVSGRAPSSSFPRFFPSTANEGRNDYHPMFFTHDRAFEELFGICIQLLNKTWKEMRATAEDFNKVRVTAL